MTGAFMLLLLALILLLVTGALGVYLIISAMRPRSGSPRCGHCRYDLSGAPSNRCPECGKLFIEAGVVFHDSRGLRRRAWLGLAVLLLPTAPVVVSAVLAAYQQQRVALAARVQAVAAQQAATAARARAQMLKDGEARRVLTLHATSESPPAAASRPAGPGAGQ